MKGYIYCIHNTQNDKTYVGASTTKYLCQRKSLHIADIKNNNHNSYITEDWNKYGKNSFAWFKLEDNIKTQQELDDAERFWIKTLHSLVSQKGYNLDSGGNTGFKRSKETCKKLSECNKGRVYTQQTRDKISKSKRALNWTPTDEHLSIMIKSHSEANKRAVKQYTRDGVFVKTWDKRADACRKYGISSSNLSKCCKGKYSHTGGYVWRDVEDSFNLKRVKK